MTPMLANLIVPSEVVVIFGSAILASVGWLILTIRRLEICVALLSQRLDDHLKLHEA
jgi:hypothetical protein